MRRSVAAVAATVLAVLCIAPTAWAGESIPEGNWGGSALVAGPATVESASYTLSGTFQRSFNRQVEVTVAADPAGTGACAVAPVTLPRANTPRAFDVTVPIACNGTYTLAAHAVTTEYNEYLGTESATLDRTVVVAAPAPTVTGVQATAAGRAITVSWDDMLDDAPDLTGYVVERKIGAGSHKVLATLDVDEQSFRDSKLPSEGGDATYRLFATRPSPAGELVSGASDEVATAFVAAPTDPTDTTGSTGGTGGTGDNGGTDGTGAGSTSSGNPGSRATPVRPPSAFSGTFLPPLLRPASQTLSTTPTTADTGFDETLPYPAGEEDPILPNDAMASILTEGQASRGMAIPVATALVLAIWAFHLRMLARAARPLD